MNLVVVFLFCNMYCPHQSHPHQSYSHQSWPHQSCPHQSCPHQSWPYDILLQWHKEWVITVFSWDIPLSTLYITTMAQTITRQPWDTLCLQIRRILMSLYHWWIYIQVWLGNDTASGYVIRETVYVGIARMHNIMEYLSKTHYTWLQIRKMLF